MSADNNRRKVITLAALGGAALAASGAVTPFVASMAPSRRTKGEGAPVTADISKLEPGRLTVVAWRRKPVWILLRTPEMITSLAEVQDLLVDPDSQASNQPSNCANETRSLKPEIFIAIGICTHLGCSPGSNFPAGFLCACHGSYFDVAGRVIKGSPAPTNLTIPEHFYKDDTTVVIGVSEQAAT